MAAVLAAWTRLDAVSVLLALAVIPGLAARLVLTHSNYLEFTCRAMSLTRFNPLDLRRLVSSRWEMPGLMTLTDGVSVSGDFNNTIFKEKKK